MHSKRIFERFSSIMVENEDKVLSLGGNDSDFSGFGPDDLLLEESVVDPSRTSSVSKKKKKDKGKQPLNPKSSAMAKKSKKQSKPSTSSASTSQEKSAQNFHEMVENLSDEDIMKLRELLGFEQFYHYDEEENLQNLFGCTWPDKPSLTVELTDESSTARELASAPIQSTSKPKRTPLQPSELSQNLINAMFEGTSDTEKVENEDEPWDLPKLKGPEKGPAISQSLAILINTACTSPCATDSIVEKYKIPSNCEKLVSPLVNSEIWKLMPKSSQSYDKSFAEIQNLVATGVVPIIELFKLVKPHVIDNQEAKTLFSDVITLLGQVQFQLSIKRRYMIRPNLKKKYQALCNIATPISTQLFGDDLAKSIKNCETTVNVGKENYGGSYGNGYRPFRSRVFFGRGAPSRGARYSYRYQPYPQNMSFGYGGVYRGDYGMYNRGYPRQRFTRVRKQTQSATVTSPPNE